MILIRINELPAGAMEDGTLMRHEVSHATSQFYRVGDQLYERIVRDSGEITVYKLME
jgi:hypothetical protein